MKKLCLSIIVLLSAVLAYAQSAEAPTTGDGSLGNPYQISTWQNLYWIRLNSSEWEKNFIQISDITFPPEITGWDNNRGWNPIGNDWTNFAGNYDGNNNTINGLYINRPSNDQIGLFGKTYHAVLKNIGLLDINIIGHMFTGGLVGSNNASTITNSYCEGSLTGNDFIGGLAGANIDGSVIQNCYSTVHVLSNNSMGMGAGGLVGHNGDASIINCKSTGNVISHMMVGGLVGINSSGNINSCYCEGDVSGDKYIGGLIGSNSHASIIENCYTKSNVISEHTAGGFAGHNSIASINNCFCKGTLTCETNYSERDVGSFIGFNDQGRVINCFTTDSVLYTEIANPTDKGFAGSVDSVGDYQMTGNFWDIDSSGQASTIGGAEGRHTDELKADTTFLNADWNFCSIWGLCDTINDGYPHLFWQSPIPRIQTVSIVNNTIGSVYINGDLIHLGNPSPFQYGYCWNTNGDPSLNDDKIELGTADTIGVFQTMISELIPNTYYYIRAFVINDIDTSYSKVKSFRTYELPSVGKIEITSIDSILITIEAEAMNLGYPLPSMHGFCYNTDGDPSLEDTKKKLGGLGSTGVFSANIRKLTSSTEYYIRAYITNKAGTVYGDIISFTTLETNIDEVLPITFGLSQNYPNPFNPTTAISLQLSADSEVELSIFDMNGGKVATLVNGSKPKGHYTVSWDASGLSSGIYFYRLQAGDLVETKKMVFMK